MSLQLLQLNKKKVWLNARVNDLIVDGVLSGGDNKQVLSATINDGTGDVGQIVLNLFSNELSGGGHKNVLVSVSGGNITGLTTTSQLTLTFDTPPSHLPLNACFVPILVDNTTLGYGEYSNAGFVVRFQSNLTGPTHTLKGFNVSYVSST